MNKLNGDRAMSFLLVYLALGLVAGFISGFTLNGARHTRIVHQPQTKISNTLTADQLGKLLGKPAQVKTINSNVLEAIYTGKGYAIYVYVSKNG